MMKVALFLFISVNLLFSSLVAQNHYEQYKRELTFGRGTAQHGVWRPDGEAIAVSGNQGVWIYNPNFEDILHLQVTNATQSVWNPSGTQIAVTRGIDIAGTWDTTVYILDTTTADLIQTLSVPDYLSEITSVTWHPNGEQIAISGGHQIWIWNVLTGERLYTLDVDGWVNTIDWSPDGNSLLGSTNQIVFLWDIDEDNFSTQFDVAHVQDVAWNPSGEEFALVRSSAQQIENSLQVWSIENNSPRLNIQAGFAISVSWSSNGDLLATGTSNHLAQVWNSETGQLVANLRGHTRSVDTIEWQPDNNVILSVSTDSTARLWSINLQDPPDAVHQASVLQAHTDTITALAWSPNDTHFATGSRDGGVRLWNIETGRVSLLRSYIGEVHALAWSPDGQMIAVDAADNSRKVEILCLEMCTYPDISFPATDIDFKATISWNPIGTDIVFAQEDSVLIGNLRQSIVNRVQHETLPRNQQIVLWSPVTDTIASVGNEQNVHVWNASSYEIQRILLCQSCNLRSLVWNPNGDMIAAGGEFGESGGVIVIWEISDEEPKQMIIVNGPAVTDLSWSVRHQLASVHKGEVSIWDTQTNTLLQMIVDPLSMAIRTSWNSEGDVLAIVTQNGTINLWMK